MAIVKPWPSWPIQKWLLYSSSAVLIFSWFARAAISRRTVPAMGGWEGKKRSPPWGLQLLTPVWIHDTAAATEVGVKISVPAAVHQAMAPSYVAHRHLEKAAHPPSCQGGDNIREKDFKKYLKKKKKENLSWIINISVAIGMPRLTRGTSKGSRWSSHWRRLMPGHEAASAVAGQDGTRGGWKGAAGLKNGPRPRSRPPPSPLPGPRSLCGAPFPSARRLLPASPPRCGAAPARPPPEEAIPPQPRALGRDRPAPGR